MAKRLTINLGEDSGKTLTIRRKDSRKTLVMLHKSDSIGNIAVETKLEFPLDKEILKNGVQYSKLDSLADGFILLLDNRFDLRLKKIAKENNESVYALDVKSGNPRSFPYLGRQVGNPDRLFPYLGGRFCRHQKLCGQGNRIIDSVSGPYRGR